MQTQSQSIKVIAAVVDDRQLTLYQEDGETLNILQGDPRLAKIIQIITPILAAGPGAVAEINLDEEKQVNHYEAYQKQTKGSISFFKVAKSWLDKLINVPKSSTEQIRYVSPQTLGSPPNTKAEKLLSVAAEIIAHAQPASAPDFNDANTGDLGSHTVVAVVGERVVTNIEKIKPQLKHAIANASTKGMDNFLQRCATVTESRRHSVEDLLKFLERGDLPIADDGSIVIYKVLTRKGEAYVDCHTKRVTQRVGSYVCMDPAMVDHNRSQECSNGLHVARRAYIRNFSGNVVVLAKVKPEDVIAVPEHDANKMRVCGYHILFELSNEAYDKLRGNQPFTDSEEAKLLLGRALAGDHSEPIEEVRITKDLGEGLKITPWITIPPDTIKIAEPEPEKIVVKAIEALPDKEEDDVKAPKVNPKTVVAAVIAAKVAVESRREKAIRLHEEFILASTKQGKLKAAELLLQFKKQTKQGWEALGLKPDTGDRLSHVMNEKTEK